MAAEAPVILRRVIEGHRRLNPRLDEKAFDPDQPRWPRGHARAGQWRPKLDTQDINAASFARAMGSVKAAYGQLLADGPIERSDPERLADLGSRIDAVATTHSTLPAYQRRRNAIAHEIDDAYKELDRLDVELKPLFEPMRVPPDQVHRATAWSREQRKKRDAIVQQIEDVHDGIVRMQEERWRTKGAESRAYRDAIVGVLNELRPMGGKLNAKPQFVNDAPPASEQVIKIALRNADENIREIQRLLPSSWIGDMNHAGTARIDLHSKRIRGYQRFEGSDRAGAVTYQPLVAAGKGDSEIALNTGHTARTYLHEVGHRVQAVAASNAVGGTFVGSIRHQAERRFLTRRTEGEKLTPLTELCPGQGYEIYEAARPDKFPHPYYGKQYGGGYDDPYNELLTMSLENLFYGDLLFEDPETANWILGTLAAT
jgi:hypothetical protein